MQPKGFKKLVIDNINGEGKELSKIELKKQKEEAKKNIEEAEQFVLIYITEKGNGATSSVNRNELSRMLLCLEYWVETVTASPTETMMGKKKDET